jgi:hypothetical protein
MLLLELTEDSTREAQVARNVILYPNNQIKEKREKEKVNLWQEVRDEF